MDGYEKIIKNIEQIDENTREAELRNILQEILYICEDNIEKR